LNQRLYVIEVHETICRKIQFGALGMGLDCRTAKSQAWPHSFENMTAEHVCFYRYAET
jgi:hypothetical protein